MKFRDTVRAIRRSFNASEPLVEVGISRKNLLANLHAYQSAYPNLAIAPVLKSNAYGHGSTEVARMLEREDVPFFMTDSWYEARLLRQSGCKRRLLVMGYTWPETIARANLPAIDVAIVDIEQLRALASRARRPIRMHLEIDTGMHRHGLMPEEMDEATRIISSNRFLSVIGIASHFADALNSESLHTQAQLTAWHDVLARSVPLFPDLVYRHIAATAGIARVTPTDGNVARIGLGLYGFGVSDTRHTLPLLPVLELRTRITSLRKISAGASVGYGVRYTARRDTLVATIPIGYFEGIDRRLEGAGTMWVNGVSVPVVGCINMNMTLLDVSDVSPVVRGDVVVAIRRDPAAPNSARSLAKSAGMHVGELLARIPSHLRRVIDD